LVFYSRAAVGFGFSSWIIDTFCDYNADLGRWTFLRLHWPRLVGFEISRLICFSEGALVPLVSWVVLRLIAPLVGIRLVLSIWRKVEVWLR
jgi:hypothetical protein